MPEFSLTDILNNLTLIGDAHAQTAGASSQGFDYMSFLPLVAVAVAFYFLIIRPQTKRASQEKEMLASIVKGDRVVTAGGILGRVSAIENDVEVVLEVEGGAHLRILKTAIVQKLTSSGSAKSNVSQLPVSDASAKSKPRRPVKKKST